MKSVFKVLITLFAMIPLVASAAPIRLGVNGYSVRVLSVVDGDTLALDATTWSPFAALNWKVRIGGIDTPEKNSTCAAERAAALQATHYTQSLVDSAKFRVFLREVQHDKYGGRFDADVYLPNGKSLGGELVAKKLARVYTGGARQPWCDRLGVFIP